MGRKKQYYTDEEKLEANREKWHRWYGKNKEKHNTNRMIEYYEKQITTIQEKLSELRQRT